SSARCLKNGSRPHWASLTPLGIPDPVGHLTPLDIGQEGPDRCRPGPSLRRSPVTIRSSGLVQIPLLVGGAVPGPLVHLDPFSGRGPRVLERQAAIGIDDRIAAVRLPVDLP